MGAATRREATANDDPTPRRTTAAPAAETEAPRVKSYIT